MLPRRPQQTCREILISKVTISKGRRVVDKAKVAALAESIKETGLLNAIGVTGDYHLVHGAHRLAACKKLGFTKIPATITAYESELKAELAQLDENLVRNTLSKLDENLAMARRKAIYEELHPQTKVGKSQASGCNQSKLNRKKSHVSDKMSPTFTEDTARKTHQSKRSVERKVAIGEKLDPTAAQMLKDTPIADKQPELKALSALPAKEQQKVASKIQSGEISSIQQKPDGPSLPAVLTKQEEAKAGIGALTIVVKAAKACGIHEDFAPTLQQIRSAFENHSDEEVEQWTE